MFTGKKDHPRIRGEHTNVPRAQIGGQGSSPHTRGARRPRGRIARICRIIPAYAGSTAPKPMAPAARPDHPRIRGEHCPFPKALLPWTGSSPHTRGALAEGGGFGVDRGIIPAYAGSTPTRSRKRNLGRDHPRIRGEHRLAAKLLKALHGSSPHTRGALRQQHLPRPGSRIIPAYAGSTPEGLWWLRSIPDHPRIRGEHP